MKRERSLRFVMAAYLRRRLKVIGLFALYGGIYFLVFALCDIPMEAVLYGMMLAAAASAVIAMADFWRYASRHQQLCDLLDRALTGFDRMPDPDDLIEADYQRMIEVLTKARMELALQNGRRVPKWWIIIRFGLIRQDTHRGERLRFRPIPSQGMRRSA